MYLPVSDMDAAKVIHDINNVWHGRFQGKEVCVIETHSIDGRFYSYYFINHGFNDYEFLGKRARR